MEILEIKASKREKLGKEWAKKYRREGKIPAILYGAHLEGSIPLVLEKKEVQKLFSRKAETEQHILKITIEDNSNTRVETALLQSYQIDPLTSSIIHIDFHAVSLDEVVDTYVPIVLTGEAVGVKKGGVLQHGITEVYVRALPLDIPPHIEVDISDLDIGDSITIGDVKVSEKVKILTPVDEVVVSILPPQRGEVEETATSEASTSETT
ncbi:MAG: 50S ribosomal protein L25/general stress protein Ctc [Dictyoglomus sp. NZ13-RE01]|nr:MAG: 50S ribosomal protein L25/general stress protein Ctc [Dictyoglomus sp. NZ13-RE01]